MDIQEDGGAAGIVSAVPTVNTQSTGEAEISANPPVFKRKKTNLLKRSIPNISPPKSLRSIVGKEMSDDRRADKK